MPADKTDFQSYRQQREQHWDQVSLNQKKSLNFGKWYHQRLNSIYQFLVSPNQKVLELGCGEGDLLASLKPLHGVGVDFSQPMIQRAAQKHLKLEFHCQDVHEITLTEKYDVIILSDIVNDLWDVQEVLNRLKPLCTPKTRLILNSYSRLWQPVLDGSALLHLSRPNLTQNWLTVPDLENLLNLSGFEMIRTWPDIIFPLPILGIDQILNRFLVKLWPFTMLALTNFIVARLAPALAQSMSPSVSVIVPARNEAGNIISIFERTPKMGSFTELVFVEGHSSDDTFEAIQKAQRKFPNWKSSLFRQMGKGKGDAVRLGFEKAAGDILMILDADLTVPPEYLPRFYDALVSNRGEFINGVRLVYPMEKEAMRFLNFLGNKFFSLAFSWLLGQPVKDTLCGTKVLYKEDYLVIAANRSYFGDFDPFGDFDLLFGAAKQNRKIVDLPIRYRERVYGTTNIQRWKHGLLLLRMAAIAAFRLKFI